MSVDVVIADISETSPRHAQTSGVDICRNRMHRLRAHGVVAKHMDVDWSVSGQSLRANGRERLWLRAVKSAYCVYCE